MNKFFGVLLYAVAIILIFAFFGQLTKFLTTIFSLSNIFSGELDGGQRGYILGQVSYWVIHFAIIYFAFKYGSKIFNKKPVKKNSQ